MGASGKTCVWGHELTSNVGEPDPGQEGAEMHLQKVERVARAGCLALFSAGLCLAVAGSAAVISRAQKGQVTSEEHPTSAPDGYTIPPSDRQCILRGNRADLACVLRNDPDVKRIRAGDAKYEAQSLAAATSGKLDASQEMVALGALEIYDPRLSVNDNVPCAFCHDPAAGFKSGISFLNESTGGTTPGSVHVSVAGAYPNYRISKRNPQSYVYATFAPQLQYNTTQASFYGGNFWDGRATGYRLGSPAAEQAQSPPVDPDEMANPDTACVVWKLTTGKYKAVFEEVWGLGSLAGITWPGNVAKVCGTPKGAAVFGDNPTPLQLNPRDRTLANQAYDEYGQAARAYEASALVNPFTSKFDYYLAGNASLTAEERAGYKLFDGKGHCNQCHLDGRSSAGIRPDTQDGGIAADVAPLFTDFTFNNLGLPRNTQELPWYYETLPDQSGFTENPFGFRFVDSGIGLFLSGYDGPLPNPQWKSLGAQFEGTFATATVRDVAMVPYPGFVKAYMHNGYLKSLNEVVHFYNTRDVYAYHVTSGHCPAGTTEKVNCWPMPEDPNNLNHQIGNLGLTNQQENEIVAFLKTLTDGYNPKTGEVEPVPYIPNF
jgi:cytochrome c peroxidase